MDFVLSFAEDHVPNSAADSEIYQLIGFGIAENTVESQQSKARSNRQNHEFGSETHEIIP